MYLAFIEGTLTSTVKHSTLSGYRLLIGRRIESDGSLPGEPQVYVDTFGADVGSTVLVTTDNEPVRKAAGNTTPVRLIVAGLVDAVHQPVKDAAV